MYDGGSEDDTSVDMSDESKSGAEVESVMVGFEPGRKVGQNDISGNEMMVSYC